MTDAELQRESLGKKRCLGPTWRGLLAVGFQYSVHVALAKLQIRVLLVIPAPQPLGARPHFGLRLS